MPDDYAAMTDEQIDLLIAERVYGWASPSVKTWMVISEDGREPRWTLHATSMLDLIDAMRKRGWWCRIESPACDEDTWWARFAHPQGQRTSCIRAATPQRAVAVAALKALDAEATC